MFIFVSEAIAMWDGIKATLDVGCNHFIRAVQGSVYTPWTRQMFVHDVRSILPFFLLTSIMHAFREGNMTSNWIVELECLIRSKATFLHLHP